jgi:hypothetical protein
MNVIYKCEVPIRVDIYSISRRSLVLTSDPISVIIIITSQRPYWLRACDGKENEPRSEVPCPPARELLASPSRTGHRRTVFNSRIFRSTGPGSGQVRDAAPGAKRGTSSESVSSELRPLAPLVLSSAGRFPTGRFAGTDATEAGAQKSAQAHPRSARFRPPSTAGRSLSPSGISGFANQRQVRHDRSSAQHRACFGAQSKKTPVNEEPAHSIPQKEWASHYEQLRSDTLQAGYGSGFGLAVFLRQGMAAWMRVCSPAVPPPTREFAPPALVSSLPGDVRTQAVLILAGILLGDRSEDHPCKSTRRR